MLPICVENKQRIGIQSSKKFQGSAEEYLTILKLVSIALGTSQGKGDTLPKAQKKFKKTVPLMKMGIYNYHVKTSINSEFSITLD